MWRTPSLVDRKSTRLNSSHSSSSYAVFCLKKKNVSLEDCGNKQKHQDDDEQKPEQRSNALRATESSPRASKSEKIMKNENGQGKAEARMAGSEDEETQRLASYEGGEQKAHEPRLVEVSKL